MDDPRIAVLTAEQISELERRLVDAEHEILSSMHSGGVIFSGPKQDFIKFHAEEYLRLLINTLKGSSDPLRKPVAENAVEAADADPVPWRLVIEESDHPWTVVAANGNWIAHCASSRLAHRIAAAVNAREGTAAPPSEPGDLANRVAALEAQVADLKQSVIAFCAPWAAEYAQNFGLPSGSLHPTHYDILERCGARMDNFTRAVLTALRDAARGAK
jgi:hypothetical protein